MSSDWLGALIGAAERGIWAAAKKKPSKRNPLLMMKNWAKQAGFHPLAALQGGFMPQQVGAPSEWGSLGIGEALGGIGDALMDRERDQLEERNYDRRRAEDRMFQREMKQPPKYDSPQDDYFRALTDQVRSQMNRAEQELKANMQGATQGSHSWPTPPVMFDHPDVGRVIVRYPYLSERMEPHYGEGSDVGAGGALVEDVARAMERRYGEKMGESPLMDWIGGATDPRTYMGPLTSAPYGSKKRRY